MGWLKREGKGNLGSRYFQGEWTWGTKYPISPWAPRSREGSQNPMRWETKRRGRGKEVTENLAYFAVSPRLFLSCCFCCRWWGGTEK